MKHHRNTKKSSLPASFTQFHYLASVCAILLLGVLLALGLTTKRASAVSEQDVSELVDARIVEGPEYQPTKSRLSAAVAKRTQELASNRRLLKARSVANTSAVEMSSNTEQSSGGTNTSGASSVQLKDTGIALRTRFTIVEAQAVHEGESITEYWDDPDAGANSFIAQYDGRAELYDYDGSDYYLAFIDATLANEANTTFISVDFVRDNLAGELLDGCSYDASSGVAFIPKNIFPPTDSEEPIHTIQAQMLLALNLDEGLSTKVHVSEVSFLSGVEPALAEGYVAGDGFGGTLVLPVVKPKDAARISLDDISVKLEGSSRRLPLTVENAYYDPHTGELELAAAGIGMSGLTVEIGSQRSLIDSLVDSLFVATPAFGVSGSSMNFYPWGALTLTDAMEQAFKSQTLIHYEGKQGSTNFGRDDFYELEKLHKSIGDSYMISNGGDQTDYSWAEVQSRSEEVWSSFSQAWRMITLPGDSANSSSYSLGSAEDWSGLKSSSGKSSDIWMPLNCSHGARSAVLDGGVVKDGIVMRILEIKTDVADPYVVISFCTDHKSRDEAAEQAATGIVKFHLIAGGDLELSKSSGNASLSKDNPCYSLQGAVYGVYKEEACTTELGRITTDASGKGKLEKLRAGNVWVREISASPGYALDTQVYKVGIKAGELSLLELKELPQNNLIDLIIQKDDKETGSSTALGRASLAGAEFRVNYYANLEGDTSGKATRSWTLKTDTNGQAKLNNDYKISGDDFYTSSDGKITLPLGTVSIQEIAAPEGYLLSDSSVKTQVLTSSGTAETISCFLVPSESQPTVADQVKRSNFTFNKVDEGSMESMAGVEFEICSTTTGESHRVVCDENGIFDSSVSDVWFCGTTETQVPADKTKGAFPYDTYTVREIEGEANAGHEMISFTVHVSADSQNIQLGTRDNKPIPPIEISTSLNHESGKVAPALGDIELKDTVYFDGLTRGESYTVTGELMDKATGDRTGISAETSFVAHRESGEVEVVFKFLASEMAGKTLVSFEELYDADSTLIAEHKDLDDAEQTVRFPEIKTTLKDSAGEKAPYAEDSVTLVDTVVYTNLVPGKNYQLRGTLMDKASGKPVLDADGAELVSTETFTAQDESGSVDVSFTFAGKLAAGKSLVAFENLYSEDVEYAVHANLDDENQSIDFPGIGTLLTDTDGSKAVSSLETIKIQDVVGYMNFVPGREYIATGTLIDKQSGKPVTDANGKEISSQSSFTPSEPSGTVTLDFSFDASLAAGKSIVAFERVSYEGKDYAVHADLEDAAQTVYVPRIATTLTEPKGTHQSMAQGELILTDTVSYENLIPNEEYRLVGELMDKTSGKPIGITAETSFTPSSASGTEKLEFKVDASAVYGKTLVAYEELYRKDGKRIAEHKDLQDEKQSVVFLKQVQSKNPAAKAGRIIAQTGLEITGGIFLVMGALLLAAALGSGTWSARSRRVHRRP